MRDSPASNPAPSSTICARPPNSTTFAPDPSTHDHNTLGGMLGNNSCGTHSVMGGRTADNARALDILTYDGLRLTVGPTSPEELAAIIAAGGAATSTAVSTN